MLLSTRLKNNLIISLHKSDNESILVLTKLRDNLTILSCKSNWISLLCESNRLRYNILLLEI